MKIQGKSWLIMMAIAVWGTQSVHATVLDFQTPQGIYVPTDASGYGDNVFTSPSGGYSYGTNHGFTPNVKVSVNDSSLMYVFANSTAWITNITPTRNILALYGSGVTNAMTFTLPSIPLHSVSLRSFYAGAYSDPGVDPNPSYGFSWLAAYVDGSVTPAWTASGADLTSFPKGGRLFQEGAPGGWTTGLLTGTNTVRLEWVPNVGNGNTAFGNIGFSEVPEPGSLLLLVVGGAIITYLRRR